MRLLKKQSQIHFLFFNFCEIFIRKSLSMFLSEPIHTKKYNIQIQNTMNKKQKKEYKAPKLELTLVKMEEGIANGSARVVPTDINQKVYEQWDTNPEDTRPVNW
ncbi:hypothetical protein BAX94_17350 [Elizabethkingia meningoseptica]|nr:hypothetical protein BGC12_02730 [Elizabethkingia meningoseptica]OPC17105.1 hypothetical protein BAX94_17350 [Elizabethkingia meningoseptica]